MRVAMNVLTALAAGTAMLSLTVMPASAACTRLAFSVNDYGKEGPTKDAKALLDKYIAKWAAEKGIAKYTTGKKDVTCELFLNFIIFDEHTCKAEATVCWDGPAVKPGETAAAGDKKAAKAAEAKPAKTEAPVETGSTNAAPKEAAKEAAPAEKPAETAAKPEAPASGSAQ